MQGKRLDMQKQQIEIDFTEPPILCSRGRGQPRLTRARWWFAQMRRVVDQAWDWNAEPRARPEQTYLELARSQGQP